ncbi:class I SAM-dependent methyltransferase [Inquilinus sp. YAF38]|uniref:glycosyltransferase n=1 Tax=Inquilinus sp. YAF38 TaxID=3233084 RepID=UPI003F8E0DD1
MNERHVSIEDHVDLDTFLSRGLDPLFWIPERLGLSSAWWAHVPFAFWIVAACKPGLLVELGTHNGISYAAFCEAVARVNLGTRCYAIDTWVGDEHAGHYSDEVYNDLRRFNDQRYAAFSEMIRSTFDDALSYFEDGSIDLLHIDGFHTYEAVKHDFESWRPKLSERAVVLFHDTNVRQSDFGVYRFFGEISKQFPSFEFLHGHGLGVVAVGADAPAVVQRLCSLADPQDMGALRDRFSHLGARWLVTTRESLGLAEIQGRLVQAEARAAEAAGTEGALEHANNEVERERASKEMSERMRRRAVQRIVELRKVVEDLGWELKKENEASDAKLREVSKASDLRLREVREAFDGELEETRKAFDRELGEARSELHEIQGVLATFSRRYTAMLGSKKSGSRKKKARVSVLQRCVELLNSRLRRKRRRQRREFAKLSEITDAIASSIYFDEDWYRSAYPEVARSGMKPALHYAKHGGAEGRDPGPLFSTRQYLRNNPDIAASGINALYHYARFGESEGRSFRPPISRTAALRKSGASAAISILFVSGEPDTPGNQYRVVRYVDAALANGVDAAWIRLDELSHHINYLPDYAILVLWRVPWGEHVNAAVNLVRSCGGKVVFDIDDLMVDPDLAQEKIIDGMRTQLLPEAGVRDHFARIRQTMLAADLCFTTTEELAFHMRWAGKVTHVLRNSFDQATHDVSRRAMQQWRHRQDDGLIRIGYAGGSRTHQRDLGLAMEAIAKLLRENPACRLVLFRTPDGKLSLVDVHEFPELTGLEDRIEWRPLQPLADLPLEMARFDINLAPLEFGNPFCEAKSELKFFEAALVEVPTVASPTGPFRRAIAHGKTGFLAVTADDWYVYLKQLVDDSSLRRRIGHEAYHAALAGFGPMQCVAQFGRAIDQFRGGAEAARAFALGALLSTREAKAPQVFPSEVMFEQDRRAGAEVTVIIPLYNYETYVVEALESVRAQTLESLDLVVVDDCSTDGSLAVAVSWAERNAARFNRILVLKNRVNYGLGFSRNTGFNAADTPFVLPLDADNRLLPVCCEQLLQTIRSKRTAFVYPSIQHFGASSRIISNVPYDPQRFAAGNFVDAMALIAKEAWAMAGGYDHVRYGWEDYDFWCRLAELGLRGEWQPNVLAEYRVHSSSMLTTQTTVKENYRRLHENFKRRHPWVSLVDQERSRRLPKPQPHLTALAESSRLDKLLPILRCPQTRQRLVLSEDRSALLSLDGLRTWPVVDGRPVLAFQLQPPEAERAELAGNALPDTALELINNTKGWVLCLGAGRPSRKLDHVVEVDLTVPGHKDIVADVHELPFDDEVFDSVIVTNALEHYREPHRVVNELHRVLKPQGRILVRSAFMQPLHRRSSHFFNCTRYGLAEWFKGFETDRICVPEGAGPNRSIAWLASESETALRQDVSAEAAEAFLATPIADVVELWRDPSKRDAPLWTEFDKLSQVTREISASEFEFLGRKPSRGPGIGV